MKIDRPLGTAHPHYPDLIYSVNYGFVPNMLAPDGAEIDAYILGIEEALESFTGRCTALLHRLDDDDDKLIIVPNGVTLTNEEILGSPPLESW